MTHFGSAGSLGAEEWGFGATGSAVPWPDFPAVAVAELEPVAVADAIALDSASCVPC
jgi:hypothetical protein